MDDHVAVPFQAVLLDIDGVLTDGTVTVDASGAEQKTIAFEDIDAIFALKRAGIRVGFVTGEDTPFVDYVVRRFAPDFMVRGCKDKLAAVRTLLADNGLDQHAVCYAGDSRHDVALLRFIPHSFVPCDVADEVRDAARMVLSSPRGRGTVREVATYALTGGVGPRGWRAAARRALDLLEPVPELHEARRALRAALGEEARPPS